MKRQLLLSMLLTAFTAGAQYKEPPQDIVKIVDIPGTPVIRPQIYKGISVRIYSNAMPEIIDLAAPVLKLAGKRIVPANYSEQREIFFNIYEFFDTKSLKDIKIERMPSGFKSSSYSWSNGGQYFAFTVVTRDSVDLWVVDFSANQARKVVSNLNTIMTSGYMWMPGEDGRLIVSLAANITRKQPELDTESINPVIQETGEKASKVRTYQDLLQNGHDERLFAHFFSSVQAILDLKSGSKEYISKPGVYYPLDISPSGKYLLFVKFSKPYSYTVPWYYFSRETMVMDLESREEKTIVHNDVSDTVPIGGVVDGPRSFGWQAYKPETLIYVEALDGGDPDVDVEHRDRLMGCSAPFENSREILRLKHRYSSRIWLQDRPDMMLISENDWKRRWNTTHLVNIVKPDPYVSIIEDISARDSYNTIGSVEGFYDKTGEYTAIVKNGCIFTSSVGSSEKGNFPFLMKVNLEDLKREKVFECRDGYYDRFLRFSDADFNRFHVFAQSPQVFPNYHEYDLTKRTMRQITFNEDPSPEISGVQKKIIKYNRADGIELSGLLYYPVGFKPGKKVPAFLHSYPIEYNDASTAGQVRGSQYTFTELQRDSYLFFLTQGIAVFMNAQFPIVGDSMTMNDTFVDQLKMNAEAAVKALDDTGDIDISRLGCIGHSYGAFMVANLLIHTDLFKTGIAQSGAYNRTLTPFGFQSERRMLWDAKETYIKVSPFMHAEQLNEPILIIHGETDDNPGTYSMQSDRFFAALKGAGAKARYVKLPWEKHSYRSKRESVLHVLYERHKWAEKYLKDNDS